MQRRIIQEVGNIKFLSLFVTNCNNDLIHITRRFHKNIANG